MHTPEIQMAHSGRRRGRYSNDFKRQIIAACLAPGVSTAAIALSNGLNANLVRRWVVESSPRSNARRSKATTALAPVNGNPAFVPVRLEPVSPASNTLSADIRIELQHGATTVQIHWPLQASGQCAQWLREVLT
jgi:transposase-like protein